MNSPQNSNQKNWANFNDFNNQNMTFSIFPNQTPSEEIEFRWHLKPWGSKQMWMLETIPSLSHFENIIYYPDIPTNPDFDLKNIVNFTETRYQARRNKVKFLGTKRPKNFIEGLKDSIGVLPSEWLSLEEMA